MQKDTSSRFEARLLRPKEPGGGTSWAFVILPAEASATPPRRGRTTVEGILNGRSVRALLQPDGRKSDWLRVDEDLLADAGAVVGEPARWSAGTPCVLPEAVQRDGHGYGTRTRETACPSQLGKGDWC